MSNIRSKFSRLKVRFPRMAYAVRYCMPRNIRLRRRWKVLSIEQIFTSIYEENFWGDQESRSGGGSNLKATAGIRQIIPDLLHRLEVNSILDAPCGDYHWMRQVELGNIRYIGGDIVRSLTEKLQDEFGDERRTFKHLDLTSDSFPEVDVLFCRDCLQHLDLGLVHSVIENFKRSKIKYLITTSFPLTKVNTSGFTGGMNTINFCIEPFSFPEPIEWVEDHGTGDVIYPRNLGVWKREALL